MRNPIGTPLPLSGVVLGALLIAAPWVQAAEPTKELKETKNYTVTSAPVDQLHLEAPTLPDLSGYTAQAVDAKIDRSKQGKVVVRRMLQQDALKDFIGGNERMREWVTHRTVVPYHGASILRS